MRTDIQTNAMVALGLAAEKCGKDSISNSLLQLAYFRSHLRWQETIYSGLEDATNAGNFTEVLRIIEQLKGRHGEVSVDLARKIVSMSLPPVHEIAC